MNASGAHFLQPCLKNKYGDTHDFKNKKIYIPFNEKKMGKTLCSVFWQILWPAKMEILPHTVKEWKTGGNFNLDGPRAFAKRCQQVDAVFLFYFIFLPGHPKLLQVLIKLFKASVVKTYGAKKKRLVSSNHDWLVIILYCISYMNYHFHARFFSVRTETYSRASVCCCGFLPCYHAIKFHPVERIATRSMLHSKRLF